jgi:hypothetical protein
MELKNDLDRSYIIDPFKMATIYKISSTAGEKVYVGSTTQFVAERWRHHKAYQLKGNPCTSQMLFDEYGVDTCSIEEIEKVDLDKRYERERFWVEKENCVNRRIPGRTLAERRLANRERFLETQKAYQLANRDKIKARRSERISCPTCGKNLSRASLAKHNKLHLSKVESLPQLE